MLDEIKRAEKETPEATIAKAEKPEDISSAPTEQFGERTDMITKPTSRPATTIEFIISEEARKKLDSAMEGLFAPEPHRGQAMSEEERLESLGRSVMEQVLLPGSMRLPVRAEQYHETELEPLLKLFTNAPLSIGNGFIEIHRPGYPPIIPTTTIEDKDGGKIQIAPLAGRRVFVDSEHGSDVSTPIYQAIYAWAHNKGWQVVPDPRGYLADGAFRRISQMISSAARFGTTKHMMPHDESGINGWEYGDSAGATYRNIGRMIMAEKGMTLKRAPFLKDYSYDPVTANFSTPAGKLRSFDVGREEIGRGLDSANRGKSIRVGIATAIRALAVDYWSSRSNRQSGSVRLLGNATSTELARARGVLYAPEPGGVAQKELPPEKIGAFVTAAQALIQSGIRTPDALAAVLEERYGGRARPFSEALWDAFGMADKSLRGTHDWGKIYGEIDGARKLQSEAPKVDSGTAPANKEPASSASPEAAPGKMLDVPALDAAKVTEAKAQVAAVNSLLLGVSG